MENPINVLDLLCGGIMLLVFFLVLLIVNVLFRPNSRLLFGIGNFNSGKHVHVPRAGVMFSISIVVVLLLFPVVWYSIQLFITTPLTMSLVLFIAVLLLVFTLRFLQLALHLSRKGIKETVKIDRLFTTITADSEGAGNVYQNHLAFVLAGDVECELVCDRKMMDAYKHQTFKLNVTYLKKQPAIHCFEKEYSPYPGVAPERDANRQSASSQDGMASLPVSGQAFSLVPSALSAFVASKPGSYIIFRQKMKNRFIQFFLLADGLVLDFPLSGLHPEEIERARDFFQVLHIKMEMEGRRLPLYRMDFPVGSDQIEKATKICLDLFRQVFLFSDNVILEIEVGKG